MKKLNVVLIVFVLMAFTTDKVVKKDVENKVVVTSKIQKNISEFQKIITKKKLEAISFEIEAKELAESNTELSAKRLEQANLIKWQCLKYEAAIACQERHLE